MGKITTSEFQKGMYIEFKGEKYQIVDLQFVNPGKGSAFVRTKLKNFKSGRAIEFTFKSGESVEQVPIYVKEMQYLYHSGEDLVFMDNASFEQVTLTQSLVGNFHQFLKEGETYQILTYEGNAVGMRYPKKVRLKVIEADDAVKGNTVSGAKKMVQLETGVSIAVPLFIKTGDIVAIDPETGQYVERVAKEE